MQTWQRALCSAYSAQQGGDRAPHLALWSQSTVHQSASSMVWGRGVPASYKPQDSSHSTEGWGWGPDMNCVPPLSSRHLFWVPNCYVTNHPNTQ